MTPRELLGTVPYAVQAQTAANAQNAVQAQNAATLNGHYPLQTADLADGSVTSSKLAAGVMPVLLAPPQCTVDNTTGWTPTTAATWNISGYITAAGVRRASPACCWGGPQLCSPT